MMLKLLCVCLFAASAAVDPTWPTKYTADSLRFLVQESQTASAQMRAAFRVGFIPPTNLSHAQAQSRVQNLMHSLLAASPRISSIRVGLGEFYVGISLQQKLLVRTEEQCAAANCMCLRMHQIHSNGSVGSLLSESQVQIGEVANFSNPHKNGRCNWQPMAVDTTVLPSRSPVIECVSLLQDEQGKQVGFVAVGVTASAVDGLLSHQLAKFQDQTGVMVMEHASKRIVGVAVPAHQPPLCGEDFGEERRALTTEACDDVLLRQSANTFANDRSRNIFLTPQEYAVAVPFEVDDCTSWDIVVTVLTHHQDDILAFDSLDYIVLCCGAVFLALVSFVLIFWVVRHRDMLLWRITQPWSLVLFLACTIGCACSAIVRGGPPTDLLCTVRDWTFAPCATIMVSALVAKVLRVHINLNSYSPESKRVRKMTQLHTIALTALLGLCELGVMLFAQLTDPKRVMVKYTMVSGTVFSSEYCGTLGSSKPFESRFAVFFFVIICGCYLTFRTRHLAPLFSESWALLSVAVASTCLALAAYVGSTFTAATERGAILQTQAILVICCLMVVMAIFFPRMVRQFESGDLTPPEIKHMMVQHLRRSPVQDVMDGRSVPTVVFLLTPVSTSRRRVSSRHVATERSLVVERLQFVI